MIANVEHSTQNISDSNLHPQWQDFCGGNWDEQINVRDFIQCNYQPIREMIAF
ncbi:hypothetical protein [Cylindrospermopsis raciborskii]|uniref:hypothetical protein n=1 Tax=Cylindrospermopsis raciborskii TaxID=77022 RepID=UPI0024151C96|nr:hypothetical protein [Cylindrospermopsis raciborskii]